MNLASNEISINRTQGEEILNRTFQGNETRSQLPDYRNVLAINLVDFSIQRDSAKNKIARSQHLAIMNSESDTNNQNE